MVTCSPQYWPFKAGFSTYDLRLGGEENFTKSSKFTETQITVVLKHGENGAPMGEFCRTAGISDAAC